MKQSLRFPILVIHLITALEICVITDFVSAYFTWYKTSLHLLALVFLVSFLLLSVFSIIFRLKIKHCLIPAIALPCACLLFCLSIFIGYRHYNASAQYQNSDSGTKELLYAGKRVLVIVPHEDDDINVAGGIIEQYIAYGSNVYMVFVTNGDFDNRAQIRLKEALNVCNYWGIPEENVIFLGYGNEWSGNTHIYNSAPDEPLTSLIGYTETYGLSDHPAYHDGSLYTNRNYFSDLSSVILDIKPDIIISNDLDNHVDHKAVSLSVDKVLGQILQSETDYHPIVLKGMAYSTSWTSVQDYYADNIVSTQKSCDSPYMEENHAYLWENRVRLPVCCTTLGRTLASSSLYQALLLYRSQGARRRGLAVINSDKVYWQRYTTSITYQAAIEVSSGDGTRLNDFMLCDTDDVLTDSELTAGTWVPDADDPEKSATVTFASPSHIETLCLYDSPSLTDNVLQIHLDFSDGSSMDVGPLDPGGACTTVSVDKNNISFFTLSIVSAEGNRPGLSEIECYSSGFPKDLSFVKLMDINGNFVYDYVTDSGQVRFNIYSLGDAPTSVSAYTVTCSDPSCSVEMEDDTILLNRSAGQQCVLTISSQDGLYSDSVIIRPENHLTALMQKVEDAILKRNDVYSCTELKHLLDHFA